MQIIDDRPVSHGLDKRALSFLLYSNDSSKRLRVNDKSDANKNSMMKRKEEKGNVFISNFKQAYNSLRWIYAPINLPPRVHHIYRAFL